MSCAVLYTVNTQPTAAVLEQPVNLGGAVRRKNCSISASGNTIMLQEPGYYTVDVGATYTADAGDVTVQLLQDGVVVPGAYATETVGTADTEVHSVCFPAVVRVNCSCAVPAQLTVVTTTTAPTFSRLTVRVEKI